MQRRKRTLTRVVPCVAALLLLSLGTVSAVAHTAPSAPDPGVLALEQRLLDLHFDPGSVDGVFDQNTAYGVTAFQKLYNLPRTGQPTPDVVQVMNTVSPTVPPMVPGGGPNRVEIDLNRQLLFLYSGDSLLKILPVSTGNGQVFCEAGPCRRAVTPTGTFAIQSQRRGWERSPLGLLYNSQYFHGGFAIHGSRSVPPTPASHGCVRIPMSAAEWFPSWVTVGTPVYVL
jgi:lipoprotein-anchoring transpeptidase ErfK/SrfK